MKAVSIFFATFWITSGLLLSVTLAQKKEDNRKLLKMGEYVVSEKTFNCFRLEGDKSGGLYYPKSKIILETMPPLFRSRTEFLNCLHRHKTYSDQEIKYFEKVFSKGNIVFQETTLEEPFFIDVLVHERTHRAIDQMSGNKQLLLKETAELIIKDYKEKRENWFLGLSLEDRQYFVEDAPYSHRKYEQKLEELNHEFMKYNPELVDSFGVGISPTITSIIEGSWTELYAYLVGRELSSTVREYLESNFPDTYQIYNKLNGEIWKEARS